MKSYRFLLLCIMFCMLLVPVYAQDKDNDGFPDGQDACPNQSAPNSNNGCPPKKNNDRPNNDPTPDTRPSDQDGDGVSDSDDQCPKQGGPIQNAGCPDNVTPVPQQPTSTDSDGDGFPDDKDACPNSPGRSGGCDIAVIDEAGECMAATKSNFSVNIRETASLNGILIGLLQPSQTKQILGIVVSDNTPQNQSIWVKVDTGYIKSSVIRIGGDCSKVVSDDEGKPMMSAEFALEWDCSTTPRVIIVSDETPLNLIPTFSIWRVYPSVHYEILPPPTEPDYITTGNIILGTPCDDLIIGTHSSDIIDGLGGNDLIIGLGGFDALVGNTGDDQILAYSLPPLGGETFGNILVGGDGDDILIASGGSERLDGGNGNDKLVGNGDDQLMGRDGNDILSGGTIANGGNGDDRITGTSGNDKLYGLAGSDRIIGGQGDDLITGGDGDDSLFGDGLNAYFSDGDDDIDGGNGNDRIYTDFGSDIATGGDGDDIIIMYWGGVDIGQAGNGNDRIDILAFDSVHLSSEEVGSILADPRAGSYFTGGSGNDIINSFSTYGDDFVPIYGDAGDDYLRGGPYLNGGSGNDHMLLYARTAAFGKSGNDSFAVADRWSYQAVLMDGGDGNDSMIGNIHIDIMYGGEGNDYLLGSYGSDYLNGGNGDDRIFGTFTVRRDADGSWFTDSTNYIDSGAGNDTVDGGAGIYYDRDRENVCLVDASDHVTHCENRSWPSDTGDVAIWQAYFDTLAASYPP